MTDLLPPEATADDAPRFFRNVLVAAGVYNLVWGLAVILVPMLAFRLASMEPPRYPQIWQCVGMIVGVYGIGYLIAAANPFRHWPIVLVGLAGKVFGPIGFLTNAIAGEMPWSWGIILIFNDLIWWVPFAMILYSAFRFNTDTSLGKPHELDDAVAIFSSNKGRTLAELSSDKPLMIVFLRHFGCTFCREALQDLSRCREQIDDSGVRLVLVHMIHTDQANSILRKYDLEDVEHFADGNCELYRAFGLKRGSFRQLFCPSVVCRAFGATLDGNFIGALSGDGFRMPGLFLMNHGELHGGAKYKTAADRPDYADLAKRFRQSLDDNQVSV